MADNWHRSDVCGSIEEDVIELYAMGKLRDNSVRQHLDTCDFCQGRVAEHRSWIEDLKRGLQEFPREKQTGARGTGADSGSRPDET